MRIGFVHPTLLKGGGERLVAILINGFVKRGHEIALAGIKPIGFDLHPKIQTYFTWRIFPLKSIFYIFTVFKMIFTFKPNIIFVSRLFGLAASFVAAVLSIICPIPRIVYVHVRLDDIIYRTSNYQKKRKRPIFRKFQKYLDLFLAVFSMKRSRIVLCNSNYTRNSLRWGKIEIIFPPVDIKKFKPKWSQKDSKLIIYVSRYAPEKKHDYALKIFKHLNKKGDEYRLYLVGHPSNERFFNYCKDLSAKIPGTKVFSDVSENELTDFYQKASILWFLRRTEHFGIVPIEAMACGTVPILLRGGGVSETVVDNVSGILCDNYKEIISNTKKVLDNRTLREKISRGAVERAKFFRKELFVKRCEIAVKKALEQSK